MTAEFSFRQDLNLSTNCRWWYSAFLCKAARQMIKIALVRGLDFKYPPTAVGGIPDCQCKAQLQSIWIMEYSLASHNQSI
jgi:hypothetical protein